MLTQSTLFDAEASHCVLYCHYSFCILMLNNIYVFNVDTIYIVFDAETTYFVLDVDRHRVCVMQAQILFEAENINVLHLMPTQ